MKPQITMQASSQMTVKEGYRRFIQRIRILNRSEDTILYYDNLYKMFTEFLDEGTPCDQLTEDTVSAFIIFKKERNPKLKDTSINSYIRGLRAIFRYFMRNDLTPHFEISLIKENRDLKEPYSHAELEQLLKKPNIKKCSFAQYRNWVIACYFMGTGNRARTVCNIKIGDVDFLSHEIRLRKVKNNKPHVIPMSKMLEKILSEYLGYRKGESEDFLFCNIYGQQLKPETLKSAMWRYNTSRGVDKTSTHLYRHAFGKEWTRNNGDVVRLQEMFGHSDIKVTKGYIDLYGSDLQKGFAAFSPLDNLEFMKKNNGAMKMEKE
jgi:integrase/recombinase XerD